MSECTHDCSTCTANCGSREGGSTVPGKELPHAMSRIKKVIGVVSGKGGVGKSLVTSMMAVSAQRLGYNAAVLDAAITGPSIGQTFGVHRKAMGNELGILPVISKTGIKLMSVNFMLADETDPVVWRGSLIANAVKQFWTDVIWDDVDFMFIDMPPGTGDVPLTVFQSIVLDGIIIVTTPQDLVSMIVDKAVKMAQKMNVPILGIVENMSYFKCSDCGKIHKIFGDSNIDAIAEKHSIPVVCKLPINPDIAAKCDRGAAEEYEGEWLDPMIEYLEKMD